MNCQEALNLLYDIIDKEATDIDAAEVQAHLDKCHHCLKVYNLESTVNALVAERLKSAKATRCADVIRKDLLGMLDKIDAEAGHAPRVRRRPFDNTAMSLAIAALVVIVVGGSYIGTRVYNHNQVFIPIEQAHWRVSEHEAKQVDNPALTTQAVELAHVVQYPLSESLDGFNLINGHVEDVMGIKMGHFVYREGDKLVSVFVAPASSFSIPEELSDNAVTVNGRKLFDHNCRGCRLVYYQDGNVVVITATTDREVDLLAFDPGHGSI
jgi:anti-sigma factor (TIGR02949 family)